MNATGPGRFSLAVLVALCTISASAQDVAEHLDAVAKRVISQQGVVGASVLLALGNRIVFHKGYGFADLGLEAATKDETVYHVVGPMMPLTGIAILQQVERGKLSLDDDISKLARQKKSWVDSGSGSLPSE